MSACAIAMLVTEVCACSQVHNLAHYKGQGSDGEMLALFYERSEQRVLLSYAVSESRSWPFNLLQQIL